MTFRLTPALFVVLLAGCASSEPQNVSYAPVAAQPMTMQAAPLPPPSLPVGEPAPSSSFHATAPAGAQMSTAPMGASMSAMPTEEPLPGSAEAPLENTPAIPATEADIAAGVPTGATNCSTVDGVTLCDAPYDPAVDATHNTN